MKSTKVLLFFKSRFRFIATALILYALVCVFLNSQNLIFKSLYPGKIWVHRVNSVEKLKNIFPDFHGIELDVVFIPKTNSFDVNHPPAESINLSLTEYLSAIQLNSDSKFWLDFKNASAHNSENASIKLDSICKQFKLTSNQFIVESTQPESLASFLKKGYKTSFYLPKGIDQFDGTEQNQLVSFANTYPTTYISMDKGHYKWVKDIFPEKEILTWSIAQSNDYIIDPFSVIRSLRIFISNYKILSDKKVKVVLFESNSKIGER